MSEKEIDEQAEAFELENQESLEINPKAQPHPMTIDTEVRVMREQSSVYELLRKVRKGLLVLAPHFQRFDVWDKKHQSELIESILIGIPIPLIYLFESTDGERQIVDGKQRITALKDYLEGKFALSKLAMLPELTGKKFSQIAPILQTKLEDYQLYCHIIQPPTPESVKFNIFERVNRSGVNLNKQEMRFALYQGNITKLLEKLSKTQSFIGATGNGVSSTRMRDHYLLLRFIAFYLRENSLLPQNIVYKSNIDAFLSPVMEFLNKKASNDLLEQIEQDCLLGLNNCHHFLGSDGFRFEPKAGGQRRPINMGLFEMLVFALIKSNTDKWQPQKVKQVIEQAKTDIEQRELFLGSIDTTNMVDERFQIAKLIIENIEE